jgi:hypothetical protein
MSSYLPNVSARIFDHRAAIAVGQILWLLEGYRAGLERSLIRRVDVIDIEVEKCGHRVARANAAYHNIRAANSDHGRAVRAEVSCCVERLLKELDQPGWVVNY